MPTTPQTLLRQAGLLTRMIDRLKSPEDVEAFSRLAVHTSYYAAYHAALAWARSRGYSKPEGWGTHEALWRCWYMHDNATKVIARAGESLRKQRIDADYEIARAFRYDPTDALEATVEFLALIDADRRRVADLLPDQRFISWNTKGHARTFVVPPARTKSKRATKR